MCARIKQSTTTRFKRRKQKVFYAWKVLLPTGVSRVAWYKYKPGVHTSRVTIYNPGNPRGLHVFLNKRHAVRTRVMVGGVVLRVVCETKDVLGVEPHNADFREAVLLRIRITKKDWLAAGLPLAEKRKA